MKLFKKEIFQIELYQKVYDVELTRNIGQKTIRARFVDNTFYVSSGALTPLKNIIKFLSSFEEKDLKKPPYIKNEGIYILGNFLKFEDGFVRIDDKYYLFTNIDDFYKKIKKIAYKIFLERLRFYEKIMNIEKPYNLSIKHQKTRYGSNSSKTHTISINICVIHYSIDIIDALVVHELAHDKHRNHSKSFYNHIYEYMPDYDIRDKKLMKGVYK